MHVLPLGIINLLNEGHGALLEDYGRTTGIMETKSGPFRRSISIKCSVFLFLNGYTKKFSLPLMGLEVTSDLFTAVTFIGTIDRFAIRAWRKFWKPKT